MTSHSTTQSESGPKAATMRHLGRTLVDEISQAGLPYRNITVSGGNALTNGPHAAVVVDDITELQDWAHHYGHTTAERDSHAGYCWWSLTVRIAGCAVHVNTLHQPERAETS